MEKERKVSKFYREKADKADAETDTDTEFLSEIDNRDGRDMEIPADQDHDDKTIPFDYSDTEVAIESDTIDDMYESIPKEDHSKAGIVSDTKSCTYTKSYDRSDIGHYSDSDTDDISDAEDENHIEADSNTNSDSENTSDAEAHIYSDSDADNNSDTVADYQFSAEPDKSYDYSNTEAQNDSNNEAETVSDTEAYNDSKSETHTDSDTGAYNDFDTYAENQIDVCPNYNSDTETHVDSDKDNHFENATNSKEAFSSGSYDYHAKMDDKTDAFHIQISTNEKSCDTLEIHTSKSDLNKEETDLKTEAHAENETNPNVILTKERSKVGSIDISGGNNTEDSRGVFRNQAKWE